MLSLQEKEDRIRLWEDTGRSWSVCPEQSEAHSHLKSGEKHGTDISSEPPEGTDPADTLISDFGLSKCEKKK